MTEVLLCFRVAYQGQLSAAPGIGKTMDEASTRLPQGVYTTFRTFAGRSRVMGLRQHLNRLAKSARRSGYIGTIDHAGLRIAMRSALLQLPGSAEARMRITLDLTYDTGTPYLLVQPLEPLPPAIYEHGVRLASSSLRRQSPDVKSTDFLVGTQAERQEMPAGVYELILIDERGRILEGMTSNFFAVRLGKIYTARSGVLSGVTRRAVLNLAQALGLPIVLVPVSLAAIDQLDEAFITSSSRGLVPAIQIDDCVIGTGMPGPIYSKLRSAYTDYVARTAEEI